MRGIHRQLLEKQGTEAPWRSSTSLPHGSASLPSQRSTRRPPHHSRSPCLTAWSFKQEQRDQVNSRYRPETSAESRAPNPRRQSTLGEVWCHPPEAHHPSQTGTARPRRWQNHAAEPWPRKRSSSLGGPACGKRAAWSPAPQSSLHPPFLQEDKADLFSQPLPDG